MAKISIVDNKVTIVTVGTQGLAGAGGIPNGDKGDISVSGNGAGLTINLGVVNNSKLEDMPSKTYKGRTSALTGTPEDVPVSTLKSDLLLTKADVGLANVDNTSDLAKPISTATQAAIDAANAAIIANSRLANMVTKTYKGRTSAATGIPEDVPVATLKTDLLLTKSDVGLANVDNTSDLSKPISTAVQTALNLKAPIAGPTFTGIVAISGLSTGILHSNVSGQVSSSLVSLTADVTGTLPIGNGGTNSTTIGAGGTIPYSNGTSLAYSAAGTTGQALISGAGVSPTWFAPTAGSVLFAGTSGALSQDNANIFWDNITKRLGIGLNAPSCNLEIKGTSLTDLPPYGAEFLSSTGWTSTDWTGDFATGWTHTPGNTSILSQSNPAVIGTKYQIAYTITNRTAGSFSIAFGGQISGGLTISGAFGPTTTTTDGLQITPTSDFNGTIVISIKAITAESQPVIRLKSSDSQVKFEMRATASINNIFLGTGAGGYTTTGSNNTAIGISALGYNTTGINNVAIGGSALYNNTIGYYNIATGYASLLDNTTGGFNVALGSQSIRSNTTGTGNTALGVNTLYHNTTGGYNVAIGYGAGYNVSTPNQTNTNCVFLGRDTISTVNGLTNSIAIGYNAQVSTSNQVVLGNSSITSTTLRGNIDATGGYVKVKSYTVATVPSASASGAGAVIYVSNAAIGGTLAWSDGTNWKTPAALSTLA